MFVDALAKFTLSEIMFAPTIRLQSYILVVNVIFLWFIELKYASELQKKNPLKLKFSFFKLRNLILVPRGFHKHLVTSTMTFRLRTSISDPIRNTASPVGLTWWPLGYRYSQIAYDMVLVMPSDEDIENQNSLLKIRYYYSAAWEQNNIIVPKYS